MRTIVEYNLGYKPDQTADIITEELDGSIDDTTRKVIEKMNEGVFTVALSDSTMIVNTAHVKSVHVRDKNTDLDVELSEVPEKRDINAYEILRAAGKRP